MSFTVSEESQAALNKLPTDNNKPGQITIKKNLMVNFLKIND